MKNLTLLEMYLQSRGAKVEFASRPKYSCDGWFYKKEVEVSETNAEVIAYNVSKQLGFKHMPYYKVEQKWVRSPEYFKDGRYIEFPLADTSTSSRYSDLSSGLSLYSAEQRIDELFQFMVSGGLNPKYYQDYINMLVLDNLILNSDRHLNNFALWYDTTIDEFIYPDIWDCVLSLHTDYKNYDINEPLHLNSRYEPFGLSYLEIQEALNTKYYAQKIDLDKLSDSINDYTVTTSREFSSFREKNKWTY